MQEIQSRKWLTETFDRLNIKYPRTEKDNPSFTAGKTGWMAGHAHWLPPLIATAGKYNKAVTDFLQKLIDYAVNGRIHAEINPHRSEDNGTKSFRFSYNDPPLQQMPSRDEELAPLIRGVFLPEEGEVWLKPDCSQQEFRLVVHYANQHKVRAAAEAVARYRDDPNADFHAFAATLTGLNRTSAKAVNFAKIYGAGVKKFALMIGKPLQDAQRIYAQYDRELPFLRRLSDIYVNRARNEGYITLYDGARRHFDRFAPGGQWQKGAGPCSLEEAQQRLRDPDHPWYRRGRLYRADTHTALNALIQGSAARHTKLWMRACWRENIVPLLQMHDCLDCSVSSREQAELIARLGCEAVQLDVPMRVDLKFGRNWGDAKHTWEELQGPTAVVSPPTAPTYRDEINAGLRREGIAPINWGKLNTAPTPSTEHRATHDAKCAKCRPTSFVVFPGKSKIEAVISLAAQGLHVFPAPPNEKKS
jgi:DNA polymerase I-like protein with 3'-5' exonuclease and polymerase domains